VVGMGEEGVIYRAANGRILTTEELSEYRDMFNLVDKVRRLGHINMLRTH
jgi:hypothetical protein